MCLTSASGCYGKGSQTTEGRPDNALACIAVLYTNYYTPSSISFSPSPIHPTLSLTTLPKFFPVTDHLTKKRKKKTSLSPFPKNFLSHYKIFPPVVSNSLPRTIKISLITVRTRSIKKYFQFPGVSFSRRRTRSDFNVRKDSRTRYRCWGTLYLTRRGEKTRKVKNIKKKKETE